MMSAYFSATETAYSTFNRLKLKNMAAGGNRRAALVLKQSESYDSLLSTILIGNNIVNIASASLATVIFTKYFGDAGVTVSTVVMTVLVLIFGEISPKSIARDMPDRFAMFSAPILGVLLKLLSPVNYIFMQWKKVLSKLFKSGDDRSITDEELLTMVEEAEDCGGINEQESELIRSAIEFKDLDVVDVITPRIAVAAVPLDADEQEVARIFRETGFSRLPVYRQNIDHIVGILHEKDFHNYVLHSEKRIADAMTPPVLVPPSTKISKLMKLLQASKSHLAVVLDEYGQTEGIVTLEDIIEELVGEIWDEHDRVVLDMVKISDKEYRVLAAASLDKVFDELGVTEEDEESATVGGWITKLCERIPAQGEQFTWKNLQITITKSDSKHIEEILVKIQETENAA